MTSPARASRPHDVLLFGATGFTGQLVAEYLLRNYGVGKTLKWALGGRTREKVEAVRDALARIDAAARDLPIVIADSENRASLDEAARATRVVATTVGPYARHGHELVAACVANGTDYCDLTGEPNFVRDTIDRHHARAEETGARIVHCCGYDSIPSDLGVLVVQEHARAKHGAPCEEIRYFCGKSKGGVSGGTVATMLGVVEAAAKDRKVRRVLADPYALDPDRGEAGPDGPDQRGVRWDPDLGEWTGPFVMAAINTRIVRRSNALLGYAYGRGFRYSEAMSFGKKGWMRAATVAAGSAAFVGFAVVPPLAELLEKTVLPAPGEGPSEEVRTSGYFTSHLVGTGARPDGARFKVRATVKGTSDPGYGETAKMFSEAAVCLARGEGKGGVLTPASAIGMRLVERLREAGMTFEAHDA